MPLSFPAASWRWPRWWMGVVLLASLRLAHVNLLWSDEDYHLAAALQILHGHVPYRDFWYDKPPLAALFYCLIGANPGWPLRLLDIAFVVACSWIAYRIAKSWCGEREGRTAALLLAFFTAFYLPSATIPFAVDALLLLPHLAAICFAMQRQPFWSGLCCAAGLLTNVKAVFVAATCAFWLWADLPLFAAGLTLPLVIALASGAALGLLSDFYNQVWEWGLIYARGASAPNSVRIGLKHTADWLAFHGALTIGVIFAARRNQDRFRLLVWLGFSFIALLFGNHFAPRYYFQLLPVMVIFGARGVVSAVDTYGRPALVILLLLFLTPLIRFGPRYVQLVAGSQNWPDVALDKDSQRAALIVNALKKPGDTLFVWGYRPDIYVYTRLIPPGKFWDSQPLDGVPADRHLQSSEAILTGAARENRAQLIQTRPAFIVDGLALLNPALRPDRFPEVSKWLQHYRLIRRTGLSRIYQLKPNAAGP